MRTFLYFLLVIVLIFQAGCGGFKDLDKRFFVVSIGLDKGKTNKYNVHLKLAVPSSQAAKSGENEFTIRSREANSITEAIRLIKAEVDKELDFGHAKIIVVGESLVKEDVREVFDWFVRRRDIQGIAWVAIGSPTAREVLLVKPKGERFASNALFQSFGRSGTESAYTITEMLFDFYRRLREKGKSAFLPIIKAEKDHFNISQVAIFKDNRMKVILTPEETRILNVLMNQYNKVEIQVKEGKEIFFISIEDVKVDFTIHEKSKPPKIEYQVQVTGILEEVQLDVNTNQVKKMEKQANKALEKAILELSRKLQKEQIDPLGFGLLYQARHFNNKTEWEIWQNLYRQAEFEANAKVTIAGTGIVR